MKRTRIIYWIVTILFAAVMFGSAIPDLLSQPVALQGFKEMGYPAYLTTFLGAAKMLGVIALFVPGFPRVREWAYAGLIFDLAGATYSVASIGKEFAMWSPMLVFIALGFTSFALYRKLRKSKAIQAQSQGHLAIA
ncbi:MAG: DoxX family protein [Sphingobacteriales bacterium]|nr:MAG: DoxX family protein [Sphingobacteriales bacterium]